MPTELNDLMVYIAAFIFVLALIAFLAWLLKNLFQGGSSAGLLRRGERRLGVVDTANVDGRRRLILIRRDNMEHLIMTGGPIDLVIESGIQAGAPLARRTEARGDDSDVVIQRDPARQASEP